MSQLLPSFYTDELTRALNEAAFGIHSYDVLSPIAVQDACQDSQAVARVTLLEGMIIYLRLSIAGYQVRLSPTTSFLPSPASAHSFLSAIPRYRYHHHHQVIASPDAANPGSPQLEIVESLETMLRILSPLYATKHTDLLVQRLRQEAICR